MTYAFISYVRENKKLVDKLVTELKKRGINVWIDRNEIMPGQRWQDAISEAIREGAYFIACYSKQLERRSETYMFEELNVALDRFRAMPPRRVWLIPVMLNATEIPSIRLSKRESIRDIHCIKLYENWDKGIHAIVKVMGRENSDYRRALFLLDLILNHPEDRWHAISKLGELHLACEPALQALEFVLDHCGPRECWAAVNALAKIGLGAERSMPAVMRWIRRCVHLDFHARQAPLPPWMVFEDNPVDGHTSFQLWTLKTLSKYAVPGLIEIIDGTDNRESIITSIFQDLDEHERRINLYELRSKRTVECRRHFALLVDPEVELRGLAITALRVIGYENISAVIPAIPALIRALCDPLPVIRYLASMAFISFDTPEEDVRMESEASLNKKVRAILRRRKDFCAEDS